MSRSNDNDKEDCIEKEGEFITNIIFFEKKKKYYLASTLVSTRENNNSLEK